MSLRSCGYTKAKVKANTKNAVLSSPLKIFDRPETTSRGLFFLRTKTTQRANSQWDAQGCDSWSWWCHWGEEKCPDKGSGLACPHHRARVQQNTWSGDPGSKKGNCAPMFFHSLVSTVVQVEELLMPALRSLSCQVVPVQSFAHRKKSCK